MSAWLCRLWHDDRILEVNGNPYEKDALFTVALQCTRCGRVHTVPSDSLTLDRTFQVIDWIDEHRPYLNPNPTDPEELP